MDFGKIVKYGFKAMAGYAAYRIAAPHLQKGLSAARRSFSSLKKNIQERKNYKPVFSKYQIQFHNTQRYLQEHIDKVKTRLFKKSLDLKQKLEEIRILTNKSRNDSLQLIQNTRDIIKEGEFEQKEEQVDIEKSKLRQIKVQAQIDELQQELNESNEDQIQSSNIQNED